MRKPSVIVFDLGKVLVDFDYSIASRQIAPRCKLAEHPTRFFTEHAPLLFRYESGLINTQQFFDEICALSGFVGNYEEFGGFFADIFTAIPTMIELHAQVRRNGFPTFIFSNTNELAIHHIRARFPFFQNFDGYIFSYEHGLMKPDAKLYEIVEREIKHRGDEILYVDDRPENIETGVARGWQTILHETPEQTRAGLEKAGVLNQS